MIRRGFSLIELLVAMLILVLLATAVTLALEMLQSHARDATRKESLQAYQVGFEQFRVGTGHYMVDKRISIGSTANSVPGYKNMGYGRLTRSNTSPSSLFSYPSTDSIADVLQAAGYIAKIQNDPRLQPTDIKSSDDILVNGGFTGDYYLAVCDYSGTMITDILKSTSTKQYSLYATLESSTAKLSGTACGSLSGAGPTEDSTTSGFNYAVGNKY